MKRRLLLIAALPLLIAGSCPKPPSSATTKQTAIAGGYDVELASVAIVHPDRCPGGRLTIASWGSLFNGPLDGSAAMTDVTQQLYAAFPAQPGQPWTWGGDPVMARMPNGDLLFARQGLVGVNPDLDPAATPDQIMRGIQWFWSSNDCGQTWTAHSTIDTRDVLGGVCAVPRKNADGSFLQAGWDRGELAVDPVSGKAYFNTDCDSDAPGDGYTTRLFVLEPGANQWTASPVILPRYPPAVMTVTKSGALWLFHCEDDRPMLYRSTDGGMSFAPPVQVNAELSEKRACGSVVNATPVREAIIGIHGSEELAGHQEVLTYDYGLSRASVDGVRITYPTLIDGRARLVSLSANRKNEDEINVLNLVHHFKQETADGSEIQPSFIDRDDVGPHKNPLYTSVLYWLESSPGANDIRVRYSISRAGINFEDTKTIGSPWTPNFEPAMPIANWAGDYQNGAYYCKNGKMNFVLVWPESDPATTTPNVGIRYATVTVDEDC